MHWNGCVYILKLLSLQGTWHLSPLSLASTELHFYMRRSLHGFHSTIIFDVFHSLSLYELKSVTLGNNLQWIFTLRDFKSIVISSSALTLALKSEMSFKLIWSTSECTDGFNQIFQYCSSCLTRRQPWATRNSG